MSVVYGPQKLTPGGYLCPCIVRVKYWHSRAQWYFIVKGSSGPSLCLWCRLWVTLVPGTSLVNAQSSHLVTVKWLCRESYFITNQRRSYWWKISPLPTSVMKDNTHYSVIQSWDPWAGQEVEANLIDGWFSLQAICWWGALREKETGSPGPWLRDLDCHAS